MKKKIVVMLLAAVVLSASASAGFIPLSEDFEAPVVVGYDDKTAPADWTYATQGYGSNKCGLNNDGAGNQVFSFRYTNSGVTTKEGVIGNLELGQTYTITFDVIADRSITELSYSVQLAAFEAGVGRNDARESFIDGGNAVVLTSAEGSALDTGAWATVSFEFTADAVDNAASIGKDLGIRILGASSSSNIDNVSISAVPEPATLALLGIGGLLLRRKRLS